MDGVLFDSNDWGEIGTEIFFDFCTVEFHFTVKVLPYLLLGVAAFSSNSHQSMVSATERLNM